MRVLVTGTEGYLGSLLAPTLLTEGHDVLGVDTGFFTGLADDMMGDVLRETLRGSNVDFSYCAITARPSTIAFVKLVDGHATYAFYDEGTAGRMITEADLPAIGDDCEAMLLERAAERVGEVRRAERQRRKAHRRPKMPPSTPRTIAAPIPDPPRLLPPKI